MTKIPGKRLVSCLGLYQFVQDFRICFCIVREVESGDAMISFNFQLRTKLSSGASGSCWLVCNPHYVVEKHEIHLVKETNSAVIDQ